MAYRDPVTGIVMLRPSIFSGVWAQDTHLITDFNYPTDTWFQTERTAQNGSFVCSFRTAEGGVQNVGVDLSGVSSSIGTTPTDFLTWQLSSKYILPSDQSWCLYYNSVTDELDRYNHWMYIQWGGIGIHLTSWGYIRVFSYRNGLSSPPVQIFHGLLGDVTASQGQDGFIWFLPIPTVGLVIRNCNVPDGTNQITSSIASSWNRGVLIREEAIKGYSDGAGYQHLLGPSVINVAVNPGTVDFPRAYMLAFQDVTWTPVSIFRDLNIETHFVPSNPPTINSQPQLINAIQHSGQIAVPAPINNQVNVRVTLSTTDARYTPFLFGYNVEWAPLFLTRNTTPVVVYGQSTTGAGCVLKHLEYSESDTSVFEGHCIIEYSLGSPMGVVAERGDATFLVEYSPDLGLTWNPAFGGLTVGKSWKVAYLEEGHADKFEATFSLSDMRQNMREQHILRTGFMDGKTITSAFNALLTSACQSPLIKGYYPAIMDSYIIPFPKDASGWRYEMRMGEDAAEGMEILLMFIRRQNLEYKARHDWANGRWVIEPKIPPTTTTAIWNMYRRNTKKNEASHSWSYTSLSLSPEPPEANVVQGAGMATAKSNQYPLQLLTDPIVNQDSFNNQSSKDYLGRVVLNMIQFTPAPTIGELKAYTSIYFDATSVHHGMAQAHAPTVPFSMLAGSRLKFYANNDTTVVFDGWLKKKTIVVKGQFESMTMDLDTVWQGDLPHR